MWKCKILKLFVESPQPHVSFCLVLKFLESYKILDPQNIQQKKFLTHEIALRKKFGHTEHPRGSILNLQNTHEKIFWTHKVPTRNYFEPTKYLRESFLDPRIPHEKTLWTHEIPTRIYFALTKYQRENVLDPRRHNGTSPTITQDKRNLIHLWIVYITVDHSRLHRIA